MSRFQASQPETIRKMFSAISSRYDLANSILSLGIHHSWRKKLVRLSQARSGQKVLDCASGTADLAFEFEKAVGPQGEVLATDFCEDMLKYGEKKAKARNSKVRFQVADVMNLSFADASFDITSIAFGIRNVADPVKGLQEMARVTRPGGTVLVLEFGQPSLPVWGSIYQFYSDSILPRVGGLLTGKREAYDYLRKSSAQFPCGEKFLDLAQKTDQFDSVKAISLLGGVAYLYQLQRRQAQ